MIDQATLSRIQTLLDQGKVQIDVDAEKDILKHYCGWDKAFIVKCLREGKKYVGKELYPDEKERQERYYCIHKPSIISSELVLIAFLILENLLIIHICPCNKSSKEGKIYYNL